MRAVITDRETEPAKLRRSLALAIAARNDAAIAVLRILVDRAAPRSSRGPLAGSTSGTVVHSLIDAHLESQAAPATAVVDVVSRHVASVDPALVSERLSWSPPDEMAPISADVAPEDYNYFQDLRRELASLRNVPTGDPTGHP
jgi:hypothetical protein